MNIVILAAGDFPTHPLPLNALRQADFVVCCDSAYKAFHHSLCRAVSPRGHRNSKFEIRNSYHHSPFVVIGDGDSLSETEKTSLGERWIHVVEQDYNDLHKAVYWATSKFKIQNSEFKIIGATGKREDHTLGNISYLVTFSEEYPRISLEMLTDHGRFTAFRGQRRYSSFPRQQVSIFTMEPDKPIYSQGLKWPLDGFHARRWWHASLNEALADSFELRSEGWIIVFQTYEPKE